MKELIESVIFVVALYGAGSTGLRYIHDTVRRAAIQNIARGLPPLPRFHEPGSRR